MNGMLCRAVFSGCLILALVAPAAAGGAVEVRRLRLPDGAVQPQAAGDERGTVHLIYLSGDPKRSDVFYARSTGGGAFDFNNAVRVNSQPGSAIAMGSM